MARICALPLCAAVLFFLLAPGIAQQVEPAPRLGGCPKLPALRTMQVLLHLLVPPQLEEHLEVSDQMRGSTELTDVRPSAGRVSS